MMSASAAEAAAAVHLQDAMSVQPGSAADVSSGGLRDYPGHVAARLSGSSWSLVGWRTGGRC